MKSAQAVGIDDGFRTLRTGIDPGCDQPVLFRHAHDLAHHFCAVSGSDGGSFFKPSLGSGAFHFALFGFGHGQTVGIRLLDFGNVLGRLDSAFQALIVKAVGGGAGGLAVKSNADGSNLVQFGNVLVNGIVGEAGEGEVGGGKDNLDVRHGSVFPQFVEDRLRLCLI